MKSEHEERSIKRDIAHKAELEDLKLEFQSSQSDLMKSCEKAVDTLRGRLVTQTKLSLLLRERLDTLCPLLAAQNRSLMEQNQCLVDSIQTVKAGLNCVKSDIRKKMSTSEAMIQRLRKKLANRKTRNLSSKAIMASPSTQVKSVQVRASENSTVCQTDPLSNHREEQLLRVIHQMRLDMEFQVPTRSATIQTIDSEKRSSATQTKAFDMDRAADRIQVLQKDRLFLIEQCNELRGKLRDMTAKKPAPQTASGAGKGKGRSVQEALEARGQGKATGGGGVEERRIMEFLRKRGVRHWGEDVEETYGQ